MPVKKKKAGGKAKGKGKGKGKGKKGKGKKSTADKGDKEDILKEAIASSKLWESRYQLVDRSRQEYRDNAKRLVNDNERLNTTVNQTERDTIEVIAFLKKEDSVKDRELDTLRQEVKVLKLKSRADQDRLISEHSEKLEKLQATLDGKEKEIQVMQGELKIVKEFRKKRADMQHQLEQLQSSLEETQLEHRTVLSTMEQKFFEEKSRLQKEANRRIADLASKAHSEAVRNLDDRTKNVYRENVRMAEALSLHMEHEEVLQKSKDRLEVANRQLMAEKELNQQLVQDKINQSRSHKKLIKELQEKTESLEQSLTIVIQEFEQERALLKRDHAYQLEQATSELSTLKRCYELQSREMNHVKKLAKKLLDQRSDVELFFLEALSYVRKEIAANRQQYRKDAQTAYQHKMTAAAQGKSKFPMVRTFKPGMTSSTNSVYQDMDQAEKWESIGGSVGISELTWEQKEQVLRLLFSKMNSPPKPVASAPHQQALPLPPIDSSRGQAFITQGQPSEPLTEQIPG